MAKPYLKGGTWYARVKDLAGRWRAMALPEAKTRKRAEELASDLAYKRRRQREGLEPPATDPRFTVGALLSWWLDTYVARSTSARQERDRFRLYFQTTDLVAMPVATLSAGRIESFLQCWGNKGLAPSSVNKLRAMIRTAWNRARKAGKLHGENPTRDVDLRKVPRRAPVFLEAHEVPRLLAEVSERDLPLVATALYSGLRKGELCGLRKADVDLARKLIIVRRSYDNESTKGRREEAVPIAPPLVPYLEAAIDDAQGELVFPKANGKMRTDGDALGERLRRAIGRAGIVTGYQHSCRRWARHAAPHNKPHVEEHPDNERRRCPRCNMVLWAKPMPKRLRVHDLRHTTATLLLAAGVDLYAVARILRHTDPRVTFETYAHLVPGYLHEQIGRLGNLLPAQANAAPTERAQPKRESSLASGALLSVGFVGLSVEVGEKGSLSSKAVRASEFATPLLPARKLEAKGARSTSGNARASKLLQRCAWPDSNGRPAASKLDPLTLPEQPAPSRSVSARGVTLSATSLAGPAVPPDPAPFATRLLPNLAGAATGRSNSAPTTRQDGQKRRGAPLKAVLDVRPILLSVGEVAEQLGVCCETVYRLIARGELPAARIGSLHRIYRADLAMYLERQRGGGR